MAKPKKPQPQNPAHKPKPKAQPGNKSGNNKSGNNKSVGRPKAPLFKRASTAFKQSATGETRNSPFTDPNLIFIFGLVLIVISGWTSGRIKTMLVGIWTNGSMGATDFANAVKSTISQFIFVWLLSFSARAMPALGKIWMVILIGIGTFWLIKNPQILQLLNTMANSTNPANQPSSQVNNGGKGNLK